MQATEFLEYRMNQTENVLNCIESNVEQIHKNFEAHLNLTHQLSERIKVLENELQERKFKKYVHNLLIYTFPTIMTIMMFLMNADHQKIADVAMDVDNMLTMMPAQE